VIFENNSDHERMKIVNLEEEGLDPNDINHLRLRVNELIHDLKMVQRDIGTLDNRNKSLQKKLEKLENTKRSWYLLGAFNGIIISLVVFLFIYIYYLPKFIMIFG